MLRQPGGRLLLRRQALPRVPLPWLRSLPPAMMTEEQFLAHHSDDTMEPLDVHWMWVPPGPCRFGYWVRDTAYVPQEDT